MSKQQTPIPLTLDELKTAVTGSAAAFRAATEYQPTAGPGTKVFPPTYEGGKYATEGPRPPRRSPDGSEVFLDFERVLIDSVQSQANRMELALLRAWERQQLSLPVISVDFAGNDLPKTIRVTSLDAPHRIADALLRDSFHAKENVKFRESSVGKSLDNVDTRNATALFQFCPTALIFGLWDSTGPKGGMGAKFARAVVSEIVGYDAQVGVKTSSRIDPAQIQLAAGPLYETANGGWTLDEEEARKEGGKPVKVRGDGKPSQANHGNIMPSISAGGAIISRAVQTIVLSLTALRRLAFPINGKNSTPATDDVARTALAALGLCAATLAHDENNDLRSRCQLFPTQPHIWEVLDQPGAEPKRFTLDREGALKLFADALRVAQAAKLPWQDKEVSLKPAPQLVELIRRSQQLATGQTLDDGGK
ncbi:MAG: type I-U CRISPR-associated RAMP protein Csb1/Cas7u [Verrucomicrobiia bacterium]